MSFQSLTNTDFGCHTRITEIGGIAISQELISNYIGYLGAEYHLTVRETGKEGNPHYHCWSYTSNDSKQLNKCRSWLAYRKWKGPSRIVQKWGIAPKDLMYFMKGTAHDPTDYKNTVDVISSSFSTAELQELHDLYYEFHKAHSTKERTPKVNTYTRLLKSCNEYLSDKPAEATLTMAQVAGILVDTHAGIANVHPRAVAGIVMSVHHKICERSAAKHKRNRAALVQAIVDQTIHIVDSVPCVYMPPVEEDIPLHDRIDSDQLSLEILKPIDVVHQSRVQSDGLVKQQQPSRSIFERRNKKCSSNKARSAEAQGADGTFPPVQDFASNASLQSCRYGQEEEEEGGGRSERRIQCQNSDLWPQATEQLQESISVCPS